MVGAIAHTQAFSIANFLEPIGLGGRPAGSARSFHFKHQTFEVLGLGQVEYDRMVESDRFVLMDGTVPVNRLQKQMREILGDRIPLAQFAPKKP